MSCSNVYWFETFRLPGFGPRGGMDSSTAGGGLGLRCVVDDLGPVGAILMISSQRRSYRSNTGAGRAVLGPPGQREKGTVGDAGRHRTRSLHNFSLGIPEVSNAGSEV